MADNGSADGSTQIAKRGGVRLVHVTAKGCGNALMAGITAAHGLFIIMADAVASPMVGPGATLTAVGLQTALSSFFVSIPV